jgi:hypothetical protein
MDLPEVYSVEIVRLKPYVYLYMDLPEVYSVEIFRLKPYIYLYMDLPEVYSVEIFRLKPYIYLLDMSDIATHLRSFNSQVRTLTQSICN